MGNLEECNTPENLSIQKENVSPGEDKFQLEKFNLKPNNDKFLNNENFCGIQKNKEFEENLKSNNQIISLPYKQLPNNTEIIKESNLEPKSIDMKYSFDKNFSEKPDNNCFFMNPAGFNLEQNINLDYLSNEENPYVDRAFKISGDWANETISENNDKEVLKIQAGYRGYCGRKNFKKNRQYLKKESNEYLSSLLNKFDSYGSVQSIDDFSLNGWRRFYPSDERFFLWKKGFVFPNCIKVENPEDPNKLNVYQGDVNLENQKHGLGKMYTIKGVLFGTWRNDDFTGWCIQSQRNGSILAGKYVSGSVNGKGILKNTRGDMYVGDFVNNQRHGYGKLNSKAIDYEGEFKNNKLDGKGKIIFKNKGHSYIGEFKNNEIFGQGVFKWKNGDIYQGELFNGQRSGKGKYFYANKEIYEGTYLDNIKEGEGKIIYSNGNIYKGQFKGGVPDGLGEVTNEGKTFRIKLEKGKVSQISN